MTTMDARAAFSLLPRLKRSSIDNNNNNINNNNNNNNNYDDNK